MALICSDSLLTIGLSKPANYKISLIFRTYLVYLATLLVTTLEYRNILIINSLQLIVFETEILKRTEMKLK